MYIGPSDGQLNIPIRAKVQRGRALDRGKPRVEELKLLPPFPVGNAHVCLFPRIDVVEGQQAVLAGIP